jgi:hypothetical protein
LRFLLMQMQPQHSHTTFLLFSSFFLPLYCFIFLLLSDPAYTM